VTTVQQPAPEQRPRLPHPVLNALLVCDNTTRDERGKISLHGIFEQIFVPEIPARHAQLVVYAKFTDAKGRYEVQLDLIHLESGNIVAPATGTLIAEDRMGIVELVFEAKNVPLPELGLYEWRLQLNGRYLGSKTFSVIRSEPPAAGG
jgi:hypothetical protein